MYLDMKVLGSILNTEERKKIINFPFALNRVKEDLSKKDMREKSEEISLQQLGASPLKETI